MNTTPETSPEMPEWMWRRDALSHGEARDWFAVSRAYTEPPQYRAAIETAIRQMRWYPPVGSMPFMAGAGLTQIVALLDMRFVGGLGVSEEPLVYPEDHLLDAIATGQRDVADLHPDLLSTYQLLGVRQLTRHGWYITYFLDTGMAAHPLATETAAVDRTGISLRCALNRHDQCAGQAAIATSTTRRPCRCGCGCATTSRRQSGDVS